MPACEAIAADVIDRYAALLGFALVLALMRGSPQENPSPPA